MNEGMKNDLFITPQLKAPKTKRNDGVELETHHESALPVRIMISHFSFSVLFFLAQIQRPNPARVARKMNE